jgi:hypothetical protein
VLFPERKYATLEFEIHQESKPSISQFLATIMFSSIILVAFSAVVLPFKAAAQGGFGAWGGWGGFASCAVCILYPVLCATTDNLCCRKVFMCE